MSDIANVLANDLGISSETSASINEPREVLYKRGRKEMYDKRDSTLVNDVKLPLNQIMFYADNSNNLDPDTLAKNLKKADSLFAYGFGSDSRKAMFFDNHVIDQYRIQKIYTHNEFVLVNCIIRFHDDREIERSYSLIKEDGEYKFFRFFENKFSTPDCMKHWSQREKI